jgi:hypothetical protein
MLMNFLIILGLLSIAASAATIYAVLTAKVGYEDDSGFHFGPPILVAFGEVFTAQSRSNVSPLSSMFTPTPHRP